MREILDDRLEQGRIAKGSYATRVGDLHGYFEIISPAGRKLRIISSGSGPEPEREGWEHVSVSIYNRPPTWDEMCFVKDLFWRDDEVVVQFHPAKSEYVNHHPFCLHMWKRIGFEFQTPPSHMVGPIGPPPSTA